MKRLALISILILLPIFNGCIPMLQQAPGENPSPAAPVATEVLPPTQSPTEPPAVQPTAETILPIPPTEIPSPTAIMEATAVPGSPTNTPRPKPAESVWVINDEDRNVVRVDPQSKATLAKITLVGRPKELAVGLGAVWVIESVDDTHSNILRIDQTINRVITSIPITYGAATSITTGNDNIWVGVAEPVEKKKDAKDSETSQQTGGVARIDPASNQVIQYVKTEAVASGLAVFQDTLWVLERASTYSYFDRIDLNSMEITSIPQAAPTEDYVHNFGHLAVNGTGIWATSAESNARYLFHVNPEDGKVDTNIEISTEEGDYATGVVATDDGIWASTYNGKIVKIDPTTRAVVLTMTAGAQLSDIFLSGNDVWAVSRYNALLYAVNTAGGASDLAAAGVGTGSLTKPTPIPSATPLPTAQSCVNTYPTRLKVGMRASVSTKPWMANRVRELASKTSNIIGFIQPGEQVEILEGPSCADTWVWWYVRSLKTGLTGWTSEGNSSSEYWLVPND